MNWRVEARVLEIMGREGKNDVFTGNTPQIKKMNPRKLQALIDHGILTRNCSVNPNVYHFNRSKYNELKAKKEVI